MTTSQARSVATDRPAWVAPNRADLLTAVDGVTFEEAWRYRVRGPFRSQTVDYIGLADLTRNTQVSARPQDLLDVEDPGPQD